MAAEGNVGQLFAVVTLLAAAVVAVPLLKRIGLGSVVGYLAAGLIIGPFGLQLINNPHTIIEVAELGVAMFLFVIGLEMVVCAVLLTFVGMAFGFPWQVSFVCAASFVLTSTALVMQVLSERGDITEPRGQHVSALIDQGVLQTTVGEHFGAINAANMRRAHALVESGKARGKIVLEGF
ncbi:potassium transporter [Pseudomonas fluorescens NCIMB 11764]|uniref:Potassium transporter n=2 Tax=Pseudomonas fluorescens TaxID=294 RepID=A0A0K1QS19_PSEFL|nr:potassium transporter [Pseudomonas fluorescens NCIMB 11764]